MSENTVNYVEAPEDTHLRCDDEALAALEQSFLEEEYEEQFRLLGAEADAQLEELEHDMDCECDECLALSVAEDEADFNRLMTLSCGVDTSLDGIPF